MTTSKFATRMEFKSFHSVHKSAVCLRFSKHSEAFFCQLPLQKYSAQLMNF